MESSGADRLFGDDDRPRPQVEGWQDHEGGLHEGYPPDLDEANVLRVHGADPETGDDRWWSIVGPFPDLEGADWNDWFESWWTENYGEFA